MPSVEGYGLRTIAMTQNGTGGSNNTFDPQVYYRAGSTHLPKWSGAITGSGLTQSVAAASIEAGPIELEIVEGQMTRLSLAADGITSLDLPNELTGMESLGGLFEGSRGAVAVANYQTGEINNFFNLFNDINWSPDVEIWNVEKGEAFSGMLRDSPNAIVQINSWRFLSAKNMSFFAWNGNGANFILNNSTFSEVTNWRHAFRNCGLTALFDCSGWITTKSENMQYMFAENNNADPYLANFDTVNVKTLEGFLLQCNGFTNGAHLANFNISSLEDATDMLAGIDIGTAAYDALLIAWGAQAAAGNTQTVVGGIPFNAGFAKYTPGGAAEAGRDQLTAAGFIIADGGVVV